MRGECRGVQDIFGVKSAPLRSRAIKRSFDMVASAGALVVLAVPMSIVSAVILMDSGRPVIFRQERLGLHARPFTMLKFRTMLVGAQDTGTGLFSYHDDPRVTRAGKWLRALSLDEMPQMINVLRGDMSVVGPRPPVVGELGAVEDFTAEMRRRFIMRPGVTGLAQVSGRNELKWDEKIKWDNLYIEQYSERGIRVDITILLRTVGSVLRRHGVVEAES